MIYSKQEQYNSLKVVYAGSYICCEAGNQRLKPILLKMLLERWKMGRWNNNRSRQLHRSHMPPAPVWVIAALKSNTHSFQRPYTPVSTPSWGCWEISLTHSIWRLLVIAVRSHSALASTQDINEPSRFVYARLSSWRVESSSQAVKCHPCFSFFVSSQQAGVRGAWRQTMSVEKGTQWKSKSPKSDRWSKDVIDNVK